MRYASLGVPAMGLGIAGIYLNRKRSDYLKDPVLNRALLHLKKDQRVIDFCGDSIEPGWFISRDKRPGENWVKYEFAVKGTSGKLNTKVIGDYLTHLDLTELEAERK